MQLVYSICTFSLSFGLQGIFIFFFVFKSKNSLVHGVLSFRLWLQSPQTNKFTLFFMIAFLFAYGHLVLIYYESEFCS